ncbi:MAG: TrkH family potassium uptake protein [bacterium]
MDFRATLRFSAFISGLLGLGIVGSGLVSLFYYEVEGYNLLILGGVTTIVGIVGLKLIPKFREDLIHREAFFAVTFNWLVAGILGALPYLFSRNLGIVDALFESISGFTTTGASVIDNVENLPHGLLFWRALTQGYGGMGIVVLSIAIFPLIRLSGRELYLAETGGPIKDKLTPRIKETAQLLWMIYVGLIFIAALAYWIAGMGLFDAVCHSLTTISTGGFSTRNTSIAAFRNPLLEWLVILFMLIGATNFSLHYRAIKGQWSAYFKDEEFKGWLGILIGGSVILLIIFGLYETSPFLPSVRGALFSLVSIIATTGYVTIDFDQWHQGAKFLLLLLAYIGGCTGSTAGSIKVLRWLLFFKYLRLHLRLNLHPQALLTLKLGQRPLSGMALISTLIFILLYLLLTGIGAIILTLEGYSFEDSLFASAICAGGIGPGIGPLGPTETFSQVPHLGKITLCGLMILGRLEIFTVLVLFTRGFWRP